MPEDGDFHEINFDIEFDSIQRSEKVNVLNKKINKMNHRQSLGIADKTDEWKLN